MSKKIHIADNSNGMAPLSDTTYCGIEWTVNEEVDVVFYRDHAKAHASIQGKSVCRKCRKEELSRMHDELMEEYDADEALMDS